ncbi:hypothetical protein PROVRETT_08160 [Providencia rettgeri DSM 1131]|nr:hypothetical protein PROVRETT_08160 [Providencia rettgeri DSM 1131]
MVFISHNTNSENQKKSQLLLTNFNTAFFFCFFTFNKSSV